MPTKPQRGISDWAHGPLGLPMAAILLFLGTVVGSRWLLLSGGVLGGAWLVDLLSLSWSGITLLETYPRVLRGTVGDVVRTDSGVTEVKGRPATATRIEFDGHIARLRALTVEPMGAWDRREVRLDVELTTRGASDHVDVTMLRRGPLGLAIARVTHRAPCDVLVLPVPSQPFDLVLWGSADSGKVFAAPAGIELAGLREWRTGDRARDISWRATARRGGAPVVVERGEPLAPAVRIVLHGPAAVPGGDPGWEPLLGRVAATVLAAHRHGRGCSLRWATPHGEQVAVEGTLDQLMRALAGLPPADVPLGLPGAPRAGEVAVATRQAQAYGVAAAVVA